MYVCCEAPVRVDDIVTVELVELPIISKQEGVAPTAVPSLAVKVVKLVAKSVFVTFRFNKASSSVLVYVVDWFAFNNNEASVADLV